MSQVRIAGCVDVETTGLSPYKDEIIEFALILFSYDQTTGRLLDVTEEYCGLREPTCPIHWGASQQHGLTKNDLKGLCLDTAKVENMIAKTDFLIAHNANFDKSFVANIFELSVSKLWMCSMNDIDWAAKGFKSKGLQYLLDRHNIEIPRAHRALNDATAMLTLISCLNENGQTYFQELLQRNTYQLAKLLG